MAKTRDELPQGLMREVLETYKPNLLTRRRRSVSLSGLKATLNGIVFQID